MRLVYESCVLGPDGRCTRWSHDHDEEAVTTDDRTERGAVARARALACDEEGEDGLRR